MENVNPIEETKIDAPVEVPAVEEVKPEPAKVEEAPKAAEESKAPDAITTNSFARSTATNPAVGSVANGAIGVTESTPAPAKAPKPKAEKKEETVAIHSTRNVVWGEVGKVIKGINIVTKEEADQWLTRDHVTLVKPEDVAKEFGL
jgi:hypothetical protein